MMFGAWRNSDVRIVHGLASIVSGITMPEPTNVLNAAGATRLSSISTAHTATHRPMIVHVTTGPPLRHSYWICRFVGNRIRMPPS